MSRISKDLAGDIAYKMTEKSRANYVALRAEYSEMVTNAYEATTPDDVKKAFRLFPGWFNARSYITLHGHGFNHENVKTSRQVLPNSETYAFLALTPKIADELMKAKRKWEKAEEQYEDLKLQTMSALLALRTFANIRKEFPEIAAMLPPPMSNALVVNFDNLKKQLAKQPENKVTSKL